MSKYDPMARRQIARLRQEIDELVNRIEATGNFEVHADLLRYCCIRLAGFLEQSFIAMAKSIVQRTASGPGSSFSESHLQRFENPKPDTIEQFVQRFDPRWREQIALVLDEDENRGTISALISVRNRIAHGANQGIGIDSVQRYRVTCYRLVDVALALFEP